MAPLAARTNVIGNLFHRQVGPAIDVAAESRAQDEQRLIRPDLFAQLLELLGAECLGRDIDEVTLGRMTLLPIDGIAGRIGL